MKAFAWNIKMTMANGLFMRVTEDKRAMFGHLILLSKPAMIYLNL